MILDWNFGILGVLDWNLGVLGTEHGQVFSWQSKIFASFFLRLHSHTLPLLPIPTISLVLHHCQNSIATEPYPWACTTISYQSTILVLPCCHHTIATISLARFLTASLPSSPSTLLSKPLQPLFTPPTTLSQTSAITFHPFKSGKLSLLRGGFTLVLCSGGNSNHPSRFSFSVYAVLCIL